MNKEQLMQKIRTANNGGSPSAIHEVVERQYKDNIVPLVREFLIAKKRYDSSSSIKNGSAMQDARDALKCEVRRVEQLLMDKWECEWSSIITKRELMEMMDEQIGLLNMNVED